jgi:oxaloacetate decarboxylase alpha subunit
MRVAVEETIKQNAHASGTICYTTSPIHTVDLFVDMAKELEQLGVHSICIKDMAGILDPKTAYDIVRGIKESVDLPLIIHAHSMPGLSCMTYLKAAEAGADVIDTATSPLSGGASQPATETMVYTLNQFGYDTGINADKMKEVSDFFKVVRDESLESGLLDPTVLTTDTDCLTYQIPGGMLSNLISQLKMQNALHLLGEVLLETPRVRADLGYPPLVTPTSQMVGAQAVVNVLTGKRYKIISREVKAYIRGEYGNPPGQVDPELAQSVLNGEQPLTGSYAETLPAIFEKTKEAIASVEGKTPTDEEVLSHIAFPNLSKWADIKVDILDTV